MSQQNKNININNTEGQKSPQKLGLWALTAVVLSAMVGGDL